MEESQLREVFFAYCGKVVHFVDPKLKVIAVFKVIRKIAAIVVDSVVKHPCIPNDPQLPASQSLYVPKPSRIPQRTSSVMPAPSTPAETGTVDTARTRQVLQQRHTECKHN